MKKVLVLAMLTVFFSLLAFAPAFAKDKVINSAGPYLFKANEVNIYVPSPTDKFVEAGYASSGFLWKLVRDKDQSNGLFVLKGDFNDVMDGVSNGDIEYSNLSRYARVQVQDKGTDYDAKTFQKAVARARKEVGDSVPSSEEEPKRMLIKRLKALDLKDGKLKERTSLGRLFSKPNAYSYAVLIKEKKDGKTFYVLAGFTLIRVKNKLLSTYIYANYKNKKTLKWLRETSELWSDAIMKANK